VRGEERMIVDVRKLAERLAVRGGWKADELRGLAAKTPPVTK
jgi:hypothetical protein